MLLTKAEAGNFVTIEIMSCHVDHLFSVFRITRGLGQRIRMRRRYQIQQGREGEGLIVVVWGSIRRSNRRQVMNGDKGRYGLGCTIMLQ